MEGVLADLQLRVLDHIITMIPFYASKIFHLRSSAKSVVFSTISHLQMIELKKNSYI